MYTGLMYNDVFSKSLHLWPSAWTFPATNGTAVGVLNENRYPFGLDPGWHGSDNALVFSNSYKMKMSIVLGVIHVSRAFESSVYYVWWHCLWYVRWRLPYVYKSPTTSNSNVTRIYTPTLFLKSFSCSPFSDTLLFASSTNGPLIGQHPRSSLRRSWTCWLRCFCSLALCLHSLKCTGGKVLFNWCW